jgi:RAB protein geranylgeranyltransferase component A
MTMNPMLLSDSHRQLRILTEEKEQKANDQWY